MARFKAPGSRKAKAAESRKGLIPCLILLVLGIALIGWLFYAFVSSSSGK
jgi:hypothetical protein